MLYCFDKKKKSSIIVTSITNIVVPNDITNDPHNFWYILQWWFVCEINGEKEEIYKIGSIV